MPRSAEIRNKAKRIEVFQREKAAKATAKREKKRTRQKELARDGGAIGEDPTTTTTKKRPKTLESEREAEASAIKAGDAAEVAGDERDDEFAVSVDGENNIAPPRILLTTRPRPSKELFFFAADLMHMLPNAVFYPRRHFHVRQICAFASNKKFTHVVVLSEKAKKCTGLLLSKLPRGPTAFFKVSNVETSGTIRGAGRQTTHQPEVVLNNFSTRLGRRVGRFLGSLFSATPQFKGRQAVTFHNQRDYVFVRHHRYVFEENEKGGFADARRKKNTQSAAAAATEEDDDDDAADTTSPKNKPAQSRAGKPRSFPAGQRNEPVLARLQELGPRFTLRLRWLQEGTFDREHGEYEWFHRRHEMDTSRRKYHL